MDNLLKAIAHMLNTTTDEVKSVVDMSKENLPKLYATLVKEHAIFDVFNYLVAMMGFFIIISFLYVGWSSTSSNLSGKSRRRHLSFSIAALILSVVAIGVCAMFRSVCAPNYVFLLDMLNR